MLRPLAVLSLAVFPTIARAEFPERVSILAMEDFDGARTEASSGNDYVEAGWRQVVLELGTTLANKPGMPARTLGTSGFHVGLTTTFAYLQTGSVDGENPAGWDLMDPDEEPMIFLYVPQVQVRKGLPFSLEVGGSFGWVGSTETGVVSAFGRWAMIEGYKVLPDVTLEAGYAGYIGNDEMELGVLDMNAQVGYTLAFGPIAGVNTAKFSPYIHLGVNRIMASPRVSLTDTRLDGRVNTVTGFEGTGFEDDFAPFAFGGGFEVQSGKFTLGLSSAYAIGGAPTVNVGFGFTY